MFEIGAEVGWQLFSLFVCLGVVWAWTIYICISAVYQAIFPPKNQEVS